MVGFVGHKLVGTLELQELYAMPTEQAQITAGAALSTQAAE